MKYLALAVFAVLARRLYGSEDAIEAVLSLSKYAIQSGHDKVEVLKDAMTAFSAFKGNDRIESALSELMIEFKGAIGSGVGQCDVSNAGKECPNHLL